MTYKELEALVLALSPSKAKRLLHVMETKFFSDFVGRGDDSFHTDAVREAWSSYLVKGGSHVMEAQAQLLLENLVEKLSHLPPERQAEVEDFIEFLHQRELAQLTTRDFSRASESAFAKVWDNDDDALYDKL